MAEENPTCAKAVVIADESLCWNRWPRLWGGVVCRSVVAAMVSLLFHDDDEVGEIDLFIIIIIIKNIIFYIEIWHISI